MTIDSVTSLHPVYNSAAYSVPGRGLLPAVAPAVQDIPRSDGAAATRPARQRATPSRAVHLRRPALPRRPAARPQPAPTTQLQGTCSVITPPPIGERSIVMSVSVCLSVFVCLYAIISLELHLPSSTNLCACYPRCGSVLLWRRSDTLRHSPLLVTGTHMPYGM